MKREIGYQISLPEGSKIVHIKPSEELKKYFDEELFVGKSYLDYIKEFLITKNNFDIINDAMERAMKECLPPCLKNECLYCTGKSDDAADKACQKYYLQMQITFAIAANEYVGMILRHQHIYDNGKYY